MGAKNTLMAEDAKLVESGFEQKMLELAAAETVTSTNPSTQPGTDQGEVASATTGEPAKAVRPEPARAERIDKSALTLPASRRLRNKDHLRHVARQPCLICGRKPSDPHHLRFAQPRALGRKASDEFAVPLCRIHHRLVHRVGNEMAWWAEADIDPVSVAKRLWGETRAPQGEAGAKRSAAPDALPPSAGAQRQMSGSDGVGRHPSD
jgi:hypothetical protein